MKKRLVKLVNNSKAVDCKREMDKAQQYYADMMLAEEDKKVAIVEKKKAELAAARAEEDRMSNLR